MTRASWNETWLSVATAMAGRGDCERAQVGAVIVSPRNRVVAVGYNGPAEHATVRCGDCPRRLLASPSAAYSECASLHAEANALMVCDRRDREGGTIYVSSAMCRDCAKLVSNSGLARVVMVVDWDAHAYRNPDDVIAYLGSCGIEVVTCQT